MTRYDRRSIALAVALSTLAGYVDAVGLLTSRSFFVSFMSGNSTRLGVGLGDAQWGYALLAGGVVLLFVAGVVLGTLVAHWAGERRKPAVLLLVAALLALAAAAQAATVPHFGTAAMLLAMGVENTVFQREGEVSIGLTYMTGALVRLGQRLAAIFHGGPPWAWTPYAALWLGLVAGAATGAFVQTRLPLVGLWPAAFAALAMAALTRGARPRFD